MQPGQDPLASVPSFTARRSAASNLPTFELPPPITAFNTQKISTFPAINATNPGQVGGSIASVGNLLTPPNTLPGDGLSPISSDVTSSNTSSNGQTSSSYTQNSIWPQSSQSPTQYAPYQGSASQWNTGRQPLFSPASLTSILRSAEPQHHTESSQSNDLCHLPPFPASMPMSGSSTLPAVATAQQQQQAAMNSALMNTHALSASANGHASTVNSHDPFTLRSPTHSQYFGQTTQPPAQASAFPYNMNSNSSQGGPQRFSPHQQAQTDLSGLPPNGSNHTSPQQYQQQRSPFHAYNLPAMASTHGPILSNLHNPGGHMSLVGSNPGLPFSGLTSGQAAAAANIQQVYNLPGQHQQSHHHQHQQTSPHTDRPFKCDQCQQSFNRNHDLKRHKRIHLAVKPYPCEYCEKSFSRKDALKRHVLVKGCGKGGVPDDHETPSRQGDASSSSPPASNRAKMESDQRSPHHTQPLLHNQHHHNQQQYASGQQQYTNSYRPC